jgi:hypothetical protein
MQTPPPQYDGLADPDKCLKNMKIFSWGFGNVAVYDVHGVTFTRLPCHYSLTGLQPAFADTNDLLQCPAE